jgi:ACS family glucarate transporter-like MFS transporter
LIASSRVRWSVVGVAALLAVVAYMHRVGFAHAGADLKAEFGLDDVGWGRVMSTFLFAYAIFEIPWGFAADRYGARRTLGVAVLGWSAITALTSLVDHVDAAYRVQLLVALRFLFGAFQAGAFPSIARLFGDWIPVRERATAKGVVWTASRLGGALIPPCIVALSTSLGWRAALLLTSLAGFWWFVFILPAIPSPRRGEPDLTSAQSKEPAAAAESSGAFFGSRSVWALCLLYGCAGLPSSFFVTLLPAYLREHRGLSAAQAAHMSMLPLAAGTVACLAGGLCSDWIMRRTGSRTWGRRIPGMVGLTGAGAAILATVWVEDSFTLGVLLAVAFASFDLTMGPAWAACVDLGGRHAGTLGGAMNMVGNLGAALGAHTAGAFLGRTLRGPGDIPVSGNDLVFYIFAASFWLGALLWLAVDVDAATRRRARAGDPTNPSGQPPQI